MNKAQSNGLIQGIKFSENGPVVHHLLFADDSLFLCKATMDQCCVLQNILAIYGAVTGQTINVSKSSITFGSKVNPMIKDAIQNRMGILAEGGAGAYLGLPECFSGSKVDLLGYIKDRLKVKLSGWYARNLSQGGKEVLLKSVALAMPVFAMSCFKLPKTTCDNLAAAMADFWWSSSEHARKIHWQSWEKLCLPKKLGGMGFRDIHRFNQALLAKQAWRILQEPDCLLAKVMKSRYFPFADFLEVPIARRPSFGWRSILFGRELLEKGMNKKVGNGKSMLVWIDPWILDEEMRAPYRRNYFFNPGLRVCDLLDQRRRDWDEQILDELFLPEDIIRIKKIKPVVSQDDFYVWKFNRSGDFSVKSAYWLNSQDIVSDVMQDAMALPSTNDLKCQVWDLQTDAKIKIFLWKVLCGAMPVAQALNKRGMSVDSTCQICGSEEESLMHILFACPFARQVWAMSDFPSPQFGFHGGSVFSNIQHLLENRKNREWPKELRKTFPWILWRIWTNRNALLFDGKRFSAFETMVKIRDDVLEWFEAQVVDQSESNGIGLVGNEGVGLEGTSGVVKWNPPSMGWLKCNVGISWSKRNRLAGGAWVVRDSDGKTLLHSRRAFVNVRDEHEAKFLTIKWSLESMKTHRFNKVVVAFQDTSFVGFVNRPKAWPSFSFYYQEIRRLLVPEVQWKVVMENQDANRGASLIAQSVTGDFRLNSYVAAGHPFG
ncbi:putative ribonuclease H domain, reverse transcriptase zinc-binding domain-containing protein [Arabidopsis thaliana]